MAQEAVKVRDREIRRLGAEVCKGSSVDAQALQLRAEAHEGIIVQLSQQVGAAMSAKSYTLPCQLGQHVLPTI